MLKVTEIQVPVNPYPCRYLSDWPDLLNILPQSGKFILNKEKTGCGGTTLFLNANIPLIAISPRSDMLLSKAQQHPNVHLFRGSGDRNTSSSVLKERLKDYLERLLLTKPFGAPSMAPVILVTPDSFKYVAEQLEFMGILQNFTCLVDEFHCLISDCKFKAKTELEFLYNLSGVKRVCFMSATPIVEEYLNEISYFSDITHYFKLKWDESVLVPPNLKAIPYKANDTIRSICREIIKNFRRDGYFARKMDDSGSITIESKEVVIFINDVGTIIKIIEDNNLAKDEVNVLCSRSNKQISELKKIAHVGELCTDRNNPVNRTFTFVTKAAFEGIDFYSRSAFTYIFSDGMIDWQRHDLIIDIPQILGRQRLDLNPFWKDAVLYYREESKRDLYLVKNKIIEKDRESDNWIVDYNNSPVNIQARLVKEVRKRAKDKKYDDDYIEIIDDVSGGFQPLKNELLMYAEIRDYDLALNAYYNPQSVIGTLATGTNINVSSPLYGVTQTGDPVIDYFSNNFFTNNSFPDKMQMYMDIRSQKPGYEKNLYSNTQIDIRFHLFYNILGPKEIIRLRFRQKDLEERLKTVTAQQAIIDLCKKEFMPGNFYSNSEVKVKLDGIYKTLGVMATAKANELAKYLPVQKSQRKDPSSGKRDLGFLIL